VRHFTEGSRGPRSVPCDELVLSGVPAARLGALSSALERARAWGIRRATLHVPPGAVAERLDVDAVVMPVREPGHAARLAAWTGERVAVVPLDRTTLGRLGELLEAVAGAAPERVVLTWPYPPADPPPPAHEVVAALGAAVGALGDRPWTLKGLPPCLAGPHDGHAARSRNRWYVDAEHQRAAALLFFPDVVRPFKADACRACAREPECDGVARAWVEQGHVAELRPFSG
jgi:hypothetical protein